MDASNQQINKLFDIYTNGVHEELGRLDPEKSESLRTILVALDIVKVSDAQIAQRVRFTRETINRWRNNVYIPRSVMTRKASYQELLALYREKIENLKKSRE